MVGIFFTFVLNANPTGSITSDKANTNTPPAEDEVPSLCKSVEKSNEKSLLIHYKHLKEQLSHCNNKINIFQLFFDDVNFDRCEF